MIDLRGVYCRLTPNTKVNNGWKRRNLVSALLTNTDSRYQSVFRVVGRLTKTPRPMVGVDGADRRLAGDDRFDLTNSL
jgi:hypothetical protein